MKSNMDELELAINTVGVEGEPSKRTIDLELSDNVVGSEIVSEQGEDGDAIVFTLDRAEGQSDLYRITEFSLDQQDSNIPSTPGIHEVTVEAVGNQVRITSN